MTDIKLCGLRSVEEMRVARALDVTYAGLVLVPGVRREVVVDVAQRMVHALEGSGVRSVGIIGGDIDPLEAVQRAVGIGVDAVQLVGDADWARAAEKQAQARGLEVLRALMVSADTVPDIGVVAADWEARGVRVIFDAPGGHAGELGGTGVRIDQLLLSGLIIGERGVAGGLTPDTVAAVIRSQRPALVDVSSGIEGADGQKHPGRMSAFVDAVRHAHTEVSA